MPEVQHIFAMIFDLTNRYPTFIIKANSRSINHEPAQLFKLTSESQLTYFILHLLSFSPSFNKQIICFGSLDIKDNALRVFLHFWTGHWNRNHCSMFNLLYGNLVLLDHPSLNPFVKHTQKRFLWQGFCFYYLTIQQILHSHSLGPSKSKKNCKAIFQLLNYHTVLIMSIIIF